MIVLIHLHNVLPIVHYLSRFICSLPCLYNVLNYILCAYDYILFFKSLIIVLTTFISFLFFVSSFTLLVLTSFGNYSFFIYYNHHYIILNTTIITIILYLLFLPLNLNCHSYTHYLFLLL